MTELGASMLAAEDLHELHVARMARSLLLIADRAADGPLEAQRVLGQLPAAFVEAARADMVAEELLERVRPWLELPDGVRREIAHTVACDDDERKTHLTAAAMAVPELCRALKGMSKGEDDA